MEIVVANDHAGYPLKATILAAIVSQGHTFVDLGVNDTVSVDFPDYAVELAKILRSGRAQRGILLCGSGIGSCIAANKMRGIYASVCHDVYSARQGVEHNGMNVMCLGARVIGEEIAKELVYSYLKAEYLGDNPGGERLHRRVEKIKRIETNELPDIHIEVKNKNA